MSAFWAGFVCALLMVTLAFASWWLLTARRRRDRERYQATYVMRLGADLAAERWRSK